MHRKQDGKIEGSKYFAVVALMPLELRDGTVYQAGDQFVVEASRALDLEMSGAAEAIGPAERSEKHEKRKN